MKKKSHIHIISTFDHDIGGTELGSLSLYRILKKESDVRLWQMSRGNRIYNDTYPIRHIKPRLLQFPKQGVFILNGSYCIPGRWFKYTYPKKIIFIYNLRRDQSFNNQMITRLESTLNKNTKLKIIYQNQIFKREVGLPGDILGSPIDIDEFQIPGTLENTRTFSIGRLSRDFGGKFDLADVDVYRVLVKHNIFVEIMGGTIFEEHVKNIKNIKIYEANYFTKDQFFQKIDLFFYRVNRDWYESFGRVILEAMAYGKPVVAENRGGYTRIINHGVNGFLFDTNEEAVEYVLKLKNDKSLYEKMSKNAKNTAVRECNEYKNKLLEIIYN